MCLEIKSGKSKNSLTFDQFWQTVQRNSSSTEKQAAAFFDAYRHWNDYLSFLLTAMRRTNLAFSDVLDLETAYQMTLAANDPAYAQAARECAEWNNLLKLACRKVGDDKFDLRIHANPTFIFREIINPREFDKIVEKFYVN